MERAASSIAGETATAAPVVNRRVSTQPPANRTDIAATPISQAITMAASVFRSIESRRHAVAEGPMTAADIACSPLPRSVAAGGAATTPADDEGADAIAASGCNGSRRIEIVNVIAQATTMAASVATLIA